jgi:5'-3' exonuclease
MKFQKGEPMKPCEQLAMILPECDKYLLPKSLQKIHTRGDILYMFPNRFSMLFDKKMIYSVPILPRIQITHFKKIIHDTLSEKENKVYNTLSKNYVKNKINK